MLRGLTRKKENKEEKEEAGITRLEIKMAWKMLKKRRLRLWERKLKGDFKKGT